MRASVLAGIGLALLSFFVFALHDALVKLLVAGIAPAEVLLIRTLVILPCCFLIGGRGVLHRAVHSPMRLQLFLRAFVLLAAWLTYYTAAKSLGLAELMTIYFGSPLLVAVLAIPLLGERVGPWRWVCLAVGFAGVLLACRPHDLGDPLPVGLALLAAALWAYATILIRQIAQKESTAVQMLISNSAYLIGCAVLVPGHWTMPDLPQWGMLLLVGVVGAGGQLTLFEGMRRAPASVIAPLEFTTLVWAFSLGYLVWQDIPDRAVFVGAALILASGIWVILAEWQTSRAGRAAAR